MRKLILIFIGFLFSVSLLGQDKQTLNLGSAANDGTGDPLRTAGQKINDNFGYLFDSTTTIAGIKTFSGDSTLLQKFKLANGVSVGTISNTFSTSNGALLTGKAINDTTAALRTAINNIAGLGWSDTTNILFTHTMGDTLTEGAYALIDDNQDSITALRSQINTNVSNISNNSDSVTVLRTDINTNTNKLDTIPGNVYTYLGNYEQQLVNEAGLYAVLSDVTQFYEAGDEDAILAASSEGALPDGSITEADLKAVNSPTDEYILTYESTTGDFEWQSAAGGGDMNVSDSANYYRTHYDIDTMRTTLDANIAAKEVQLNNEAGLYAVLSDVTQFYEAGDEGTIAAAIAEGELANDIILEEDLKAVNAPTDEYVLTYEATTGDFEWEEMTGGSGGAQISGTPANDQVAIWTGATDIEGTSNFIHNTTKTEIASGYLQLSGSGSNGGVLYLTGTDKKVMVAAGTSGYLADASAGNLFSFSSTLLASLKVHEFNADAQSNASTGWKLESTPPNNLTSPILFLDRNANVGLAADADGDMGVVTNNVQNTVFNEDGSGNVELNVLGELDVDGDIVRKVYTNNVSNPPTDAELDAIFTSPETGLEYIIDDNGGETNVYRVVWTGTKWFYVSLTAAI